jgi:hypothetical protein
VRRALVLATLPLVLAACGGGGGSGLPTESTHASTPLEFVQVSAKKTAAATTEHLDMVVSATVQGQKVKVTGNGDFDNTKRLGKVVAHALVQGVDLEIDEVLAGSTLYMKSPFFAAMLPKGKTWLKLDLAKAAKTKGIDFDSLISQDPSRNFTELQASGDAVKVGDETIDNRPTTHYRGHIDISKIPQGEKIQRTTGVKYGPYDVWIGKDDGLVHRLVTSYSYDVGGQRQRADLTMSFSDFGNAVNVQVPAAADVADVSQQNLGALGG